MKRLGKLIRTITTEVFIENDWRRDAMSRPIKMQNPLCICSRIYKFIAEATGQMWQQYSACSAAKLVFHYLVDVSRVLLFFIVLRSQI